MSRWLISPRVIVASGTWRVKQPVVHLAHKMVALETRSLLMSLSNTTVVGKPPLTRREDVRETIHGVEVADPYRWLEDGASAETREWIAAQQKYIAPFLDTPERERLRARFAALMKIDGFGIPIERDGQYFYAHRIASQQQPVICRRLGLNGPEKILIDPNTMSTDHLTSVEILDITPDGALLAYGLRRGGEDEQEIRVLNVATRRDLDDVLPKGRYYSNLSWRRDGAGFYYFLLTTEKSCVRFHRLTFGPAADEEVFATTPDKGIYLHVSDDGRYLLITVILGGGGSPTDIYFQRIGSDEPVNLLVNDLGATFMAAYVGDALMVHTNWKAPNWRVIRIDLNNPGRTAWQEIIPEGPSPMLSLSAIGGKLLVTYLENVHSRVCVFEPDGAYVRDINLSCAGTVGQLSGKWQRGESFLSFMSFATPPSIYRYDVTRDAFSEWRRENVPADFSRLESRQVWYISKDGTRIPMYLFHRRDVDLDGSHPTLLTGYGGFNESYSPFYWPQALAWAEAGGIFAVANLRGGGEFGEQWHRAGQREKKQNVFDDFIAAAQWLIASGYTSPARLAVMGGSNGGLLVGAALTQRPDLFRAVICWAPILDMIRYHMHPLGPFWIPEYGSSDDPEQFAYLLKYSPYHNVRKGTRYPAVMFVTGDADTRADPMHARKMAAALQRASESEGRPILLHYRAAAGHIAALPLDAAVEEAADQLAFLFRELSVKCPPEWRR
ncbi:MAG: prolyl oligopeptidase family serine peptidase [Candidatus Binataceae bacterium]